MNRPAAIVQKSEEHKEEQNSKLLRLKRLLSAPSLIVRH
jgi:hypothetical protein